MSDILAMLLESASRIQPPLANPTVLDHVESGNQSETSGAISPSANALLIAVRRTRASANRTHDTPTDSGLSFTGSWALIATDVEVRDEGSGDRYYRVSVWCRQCSATPGTGTVSESASNTVFSSTFDILEITGHDQSAPIRQSKTAVSNTADVSLTFDSSPLSDSCVISVMAQSLVMTISPSSGFTELQDGVYTTTLGYHTQYDNGGAGTGVSLTGTNLRSKVLIAFEVKRSP